MGISMKGLTDGLLSYFGQGNRSADLPASGDIVDAIIFGYVDPEDDESSNTDSTHGLDHELAGILYADIDDYARLTERDDEGTQRLFMHAMEVMSSQILANNGRIAHIAGDAILAEFDDADSALYCAIKVQLSARQWNADLDFSRQVRLRIGVNFGEVISDRGDIDGNAVNLAARLGRLACAGGICLSKNVRSMSETGSSFRFVATGKQYVKNISNPVEAFWILIDSDKIADTSMHGSIEQPVLAL